MPKKHHLLIVLLLTFGSAFIVTAVANQPSDPNALQVERGVDGKEYLAADSAGRYRYFINFEGAGAVQRVRDAVARGASDVSREQALNAIRAEQASKVESISAELKRSLSPSHFFQTSKNAVGARLTESEAEQLRGMAGIASVVREQVYQLDTYRGPEFIGANAIWTGTAVPSGDGLLGEGIIAAVIDSGTNFDHPSFANDASCGHGVDGAPDKLLSIVDCGSTDGGGRCDGGNPDDTGAHGTHTASTVAGNVVLAEDDPDLNLPAGFTQISGVAPCARLRTYKACPGTSCPAFDLQASLQNVLLDGDADVMNYSISGGQNPWNDFDRTKLDLVDIGTFVAASAGNTRDTIPDPVGQVNHRGPWVMTVAASTRDEADFFIPRVSLAAPGTPPADTQGIALRLGGDSPESAAFNDKPIRKDDSQNPIAEGCNPFTPPQPGQDPPPATPEFPANFFDNSVALIRRGGCSFVDKINNASNAGADMVIVWNNQPGNVTMATAGTTIPAYFMIQTAGQAYSDFLDTNATTSEVDFFFELSEGDELAGFSLRGPTAAPAVNVQKPNITAPGVGIFAADQNGIEYGFKNGTSMSSPHVAGAAALVRQARPDWTPMQVKSAMQMTAIQEGLKDDFNTPWDWDDVGSGRVDLTAAALAGIVMDETTQNFIDADPATGGDPRELNLPSVRDVDCVPECSFTRTVTSALPNESNWTVDAFELNKGDFFVDVQPTSFTLAAQSDFIFIGNFEADPDPIPQTGEQELTITVSNVTAGPVRFGVIELTEDAEQAPDAHITIAVQN